MRPCFAAAERRRGGHEKTGIYIWGAECQALDPGAHVVWTGELARDGRDDLCPYCGEAGMLLRTTDARNYPFNLIAGALI